MCLWSKLGKVLGYLVTHRSIEANLDQIVALQNLKSLRNPKKLQHLTGMSVALNQFISRFADKCRSFSSSY